MTKGTSKHNVVALQVSQCLYSIVIHMTIGTLSSGFHVLSPSVCD